MPQIRVAQVTYAMHCGGMENVILNLGRYLTQCGFAVEIITTVEKGEWFSQIARWNLSGHHLTISIPLMHMIKVGRWLKNQKYDIILLHHARYAQASLGMLPNNTIVIPVLHNDQDVIYNVGCANAEAWNVLVAVSPKVFKEASRRVPERPVFQIFNGVELPSEGCLQSRSLPANSIKCVFAGRLNHDQKGVLFLPDIIKGCLEQGLEVRLEIAGDGSDRAKLENKFRSYGVLDRVIFRGTISHESIYDLLSQSHALILPSFFEGFPVIVMEAQACGCVPILSRLPGITDQAIEEGRTGFLAEIGDIGGFVQAIARLQKDPALWALMSAAGCSRAREHFSMEAMGKAYEELITKALAGDFPLPQPRSSQNLLDSKLLLWHDFLPVNLQKILVATRNRLSGSFCQDD